MADDRSPLRAGARQPGVGAPRQPDGPSNLTAPARPLQVISQGSGEYKIENYNSGLLLGVLNASTASGAQVLQWTDNGTADHLWKLAAG
jgi:hypothetical protein